MTDTRSSLTAVERAVWAAWNGLPEGHPAPVKRIAADLGMATADVAFVVFPAETFGAWCYHQEPDLQEAPASGDVDGGPVAFTRHEGAWCDTCRTAWSFTPRDGCCPSCRPARLRAARVTVEPHDVIDGDQEHEDGEYQP